MTVARTRAANGLGAVLTEGLCEANSCRRGLAFDDVLNGDMHLFVYGYHLLGNLTRFISK